MRFILYIFIIFMMKFIVSTHLFFIPVQTCTALNSRFISFDINGRIPVLILKIGNYTKLGSILKL